MSSRTILTKETLLQNFYHFLAKVLQEDPAASNILPDFYQLHNMLLDNIPTASCITDFLSSLTEKYPAVEQANDPPQKEPYKDNPIPATANIPLKTFDYAHAKSSAGLSRFSFCTYKDYLRKNSVRLPANLLDKMSGYSQLIDFLPDSQNFYRVIGLGIIELYLSDPSLLHYLNEICNKVITQELSLMTQDYPFSTDDLKFTFCGYISQLIDIVNSPAGLTEARDILFKMDTIDKAFDTAVISFVKGEIIKYLDSTFSSNEGSNKTASEDCNNLKCKLWLSESGIVNDLISHIPEIFNIRLVIHIVENRTIKEQAYELSSNTRSPELHILNERHSAYQNFGLLRRNPAKPNKTELVEKEKLRQDNAEMTPKNDFIRRDRNKDNDDQSMWEFERESRLDSDISVNLNTSTRGTRGVELFRVKKKTDKAEESIMEEDELLHDLPDSILPKELTRDQKLTSRPIPENIGILGSQDRYKSSTKEGFSTADTKGRTPSNENEVHVDVKAWEVPNYNGMPGVKMGEERHVLQEKVEKPMGLWNRQYEGVKSDSVFEVLKNVDEEVEGMAKMGDKYKKYQMMERKEYAMPQDRSDLLRERVNVQSARDYQGIGIEGKYMSSNNDEGGQESAKRRITKEEIEELKRKYGRKREVV